MRYVVNALLVLALVSPLGAAAQEAEEATKSLNDYLAAVISLDAGRAAQYFHEPYMLLTAANTKIYASRAEVEASLKPAYAELKERGFARSEWAKLRVKSLGSGVAIASAVAVRFKIDGQELQRIGVTYLLRKTPEGWKIAVLTLHDPSAALPLE
jgi:ketosteroid isomerase-like protein